MVDRIDREFGFLTQALRLRTQRQQVIASNIANADTPNFKARDIDFATALAGSGGRLGLSTTSARHLAGDGAGAASAALKYRNAVQPSIDNNTVDMDVERAAFMENALHYQLLADRIAAKSRQVVDALKG